jgi:hypothetical protein
MTIATYYPDAKGRQTIDKDPGATLDYVFDWTAFLTAIGDTINTVAATANGVVIVGSPTFTGKIVTVWVSGGVLNSPASVTCTITTNSVPARIEPMTIQMKITPKVT